jgi:alkylation response protein AidB-like acyl-CoA dehydrogenase
MSQIAPSEPRHSDVLENVRALLPEIAARAVEIEQARAVPRDLAEKLRAAGVFRRYVPASHGGDEMWPDAAVTVIEELARADASVGWISAVGSEGPGFYAYLPPETYDKIFADGPDVIHSGVINPTGKVVRDSGGYRFSGRWSFASGSNNADYIVIQGVIEGEQATRMAVVTPDQLQIVDVWHVSGLKGTASNDVVVSDLFVPDEWTGSFAQLPEILRHPLDHRGLGARFGAEFAAVAVGIAQAALDDITDIARNKIPATSRSKLAADPVAQYQMGQLSTDLHMARTLLHQVARDDQASAAWDHPVDAQYTAARQACLSRIGSVAASVVEGAYGLSGTTGLFESCPLQRRMRDVRAVTQHYQISARSAFRPVGTAILAEEQ